MGLFVAHDVTIAGVWAPLVSARRVPICVTGHDRAASALPSMSAFRTFLFAALLLPTFAPAQARADELADRINAYRAAPGTCRGAPAAPAAPLAQEAALSRIWIGRATFLESALKRIGFAADRADAISVSGPEDAQAAMEAIRETYCGTLLRDDYSAVGTAHHGTEWQVVLAHREDIPPLPDEQQAGQAILDLVNAARARPRSCGDQHFGPAGPLGWNPALARAALAHSEDMAEHHYFSHVGRKGSTHADRITRAGYAWLRVGENIAAGQRSAPEVVQGWLDSPGHCANIMNPSFTEMGAAYAVNPASENHTVYWTQEFARPR